MKEMRRIFVVSFLCAVEIAILLVTIFIKNFSLISFERAQLEIQTNPGAFLGAKLFWGLLVTLILSGLAIVVYITVIKVSKEKLGFTLKRMFSIQWATLFLVWLFYLTMDVLYLLKG